jgi:hypothetical protein
MLIVAVQRRGGAGSSSRTIRAASSGCGVTALAMLSAFRGRWSKCRQRLGASHHPLRAMRRPVPPFITRTG